MIRFFADLGFRWKIALPFILLALLLVIVGGMGMQSITQVADSSRQLTNRYLPAVSLLLNADQDLYRAFVAERNLVDDAGGELSPSLKAAHEQSLQLAYERVQKYAAMNPGGESKQLLAQFEQAFSLWRETSREVAELSSRDPAMASSINAGDSERQFYKMREVIDKLGKLEDKAAKLEGRRAIALGEVHIWQQGLVISIGLIVCLVLVIGFPMLVTRSLQNLLERIEQIADGDGDLRIRLVALSQDELGKLGRAFNRFLDKLQLLIREVTQVTGEVADSARCMADMTMANDHLISSEHMAVNQVSTAVAEMSEVVFQVARNAQSASEAAHQAEIRTREGGEVVGATIDAIRRLAQEVENASNTIQALEQETASIGSVLEVIKSIAEQTNLLALNAAIEAACAGDQGRGFAVVADEVRALAARTQDSTKDIQKMIDRLQASVQNAVEATRSGSLKARDSVVRAAGVEEALSYTGDSVRRISNMAAQIATACEQQSCVTEEIVRNITDIRDLSIDAAKTSEQSAQASQHLSRLSNGLAQLVGRFRV